MSFCLDSLKTHNRGCQQRRNVMRKVEFMAANVIARNGEPMSDQDPRLPSMIRGSGGISFCVHSHSLPLVIIGLIIYHDGKCPSWCISPKMKSDSCDREWIDSRDHSTLKASVRRAVELDGQNIASRASMVTGMTVCPLLEHTFHHSLSLS